MTVEKARDYHEATASVGFGAGRRFVRDVDLSDCSKMLDLGGGSGAYSIVAAEKYPQFTAVVFDLPAVVEVTREFIDRHGVGDNRSGQRHQIFVSDQLWNQLLCAALAVLCRGHLLFDESVHRDIWIPLSGKHVH